VLRDDERGDGGGTEAMTQHVLLVSLGPVQEFIAAARRCRDLWFGSWVLSELSKAAAAGVVDALGGQQAAVDALVFPAPQARRALDVGSSMSVANKLVVRVTGGDARVRAVAEAGRTAMHKRRDALRGAAFERIGREDPARSYHFLLKPATQQVNELFEYLWVAVAESAGDYAQARREAERLLAARKNARTWEQPGWAVDRVPKSSLDGARESVLREDIYDRAVTGPPREPSLTPEQRRTWYGVHGAERLCGVGLLKRWGVARGGGGDLARFFSTPHLAALPLMIGIDTDHPRDPAIAVSWGSLCEKARPAVEALDVVPGPRLDLFGNIDGAILFPQRLEETLAECAPLPTSDFKEVALRALKTFLGKVGRGEPLPYYAILVADGDGMGALINAKETFEEHRSLSQALNGFAHEAGKIVRAHHGCLIYSGGDDVLAFLPLHVAIECALALARRFAEIPGATLSAGLAIVHCVDPMGVALGVARHAEKQAKAYPDKAAPLKNALAVALDKRSGATVTVCGHWEALAPRLLHLAELHRVEAIPDGAGHELAELARLVKDAAPGALAGLRAIQRSEAIRILRRKRARRGQEAVAATNLDWLRVHLDADPEALGQEITIAGLVAKAKAQAAPRADEGT
jgi:CRISPR-associated protein Cmr2